MMLTRRREAGLNLKSAEPASSVAPDPLLLDNLVNDLESLGPLLTGELNKGAWLNAYLLAAGMHQIVEDYLHPDLLLLDRAGEHLADRHSPAGRLAARGAQTVSHVLAYRFRRLPSTARVADWQNRWAGLVRRLAEAVMWHAPDPAQHATLLEASERLSAEMACLPLELRRGLLRSPSCFRAFDQQPADVDRMVQEIVDRWPDRTRPVGVVGVRTSGSYLAPLFAAALNKHGYQDVLSLTVRPGRRLLPAERCALRSLARRGGLTLVTDDPPVTGRSLGRTAEDLARAGVKQDSIVLLLQLFGTPESVPPALHAYEKVTLAWDAWAIHQHLSPQAVRSALAEMLGPCLVVQAVEALPAPSPSSSRCHARGLYRAHVTDRSGGGSSERLVYVKGVGLGYFGEHALSLSQRLRAFVPDIYGVKDGLLYRAWLPSEARVTPDRREHRDALAGAGAAYVEARHRGMPVPEDLSLRLLGQWPAWEMVSTLLSRAFGRGWPVARIALMDPTIKHLLQVQHPCVTDGSTDPRYWFVQAPDRGRLLKVHFDESTFRGDAELTCFDPVFDLVGLAVDQQGDLRQHVRGCYTARTGESISAERWLLYELVHVWKRERGDRSLESRAFARAFQRYFSEVFLSDLVAPTSGPICALDVDGVLETNHLGFPSTTPAGVMALRGLLGHGYRPVIATGRSLDEVRDRCETYRLAGGVAEYGSVVFNATSGHVRESLTSREREDLERLRGILSRMDGVMVDPGHQRTVRAYRVDRSGRRRLPLAAVQAALAACGAAQAIRPVAGDSQTDFVPRRIDKGLGLRVLVEDLGVHNGHLSTRPIHVAIGDTPADLPMFQAAELALAPGHSRLGPAGAGVRTTRRPYQAGLKQAVGQVLGHAPGACPRCAMPELSPETRHLLPALAAQESGRRSMVSSALVLAAHAWARRVRT
jgi:hydroxymethylpyrimidine pyrophosphatase-like HAD family hydrolase